MAEEGTSAIGGDDRVAAVNLRRARIALVVTGIATVLFFGALARSINLNPGDATGFSDTMVVVLALVACAAAVYSLFEYSRSRSRTR